MAGTDRIQVLDATTGRQAEEEIGAFLAGSIPVATPIADGLMASGDKDKLDNIVSPLLWKDAIAVAADFPTLADVESGWCYTCSANVTDNDLAKTNTGQSFVQGDEIIWNGATWTDVGQLHTHAASHVTGGSDVIPDAVAGATAGLLSGADKTKLDGIAAGATVGRPKTDYEWFVDCVNGSDTTGDGSESAPYLTIQKAIDEAHAIDVAAGFALHHTIRLQCGNGMTSYQTAQMTYVGASYAVGVPVPWVAATAMHVTIVGLTDRDRRYTNDVETNYYPPMLGNFGIIGNGKVAFLGCYFYAEAGQPTWDAVYVANGMAWFEDCTVRARSGHALSGGADTPHSAGPDEFAGVGASIYANNTLFRDATLANCVHIDKSLAGRHEFNRCTLRCSAAAAAIAALYVDGSDGADPKAGLHVIDSDVRVSGGAGAFLGQAINAFNLADPAILSEYSLLLERSTFEGCRTVNTEWVVAATACDRARVARNKFIDAQVPPDDTVTNILVSIAATGVVEWADNADQLGQEVFHSITPHTTRHYTTRVVNKHRWDGMAYASLEFALASGEPHVFLVAGNNGEHLPVSVVYSLGGGVWAECPVVQPAGGLAAGDVSLQWATAATPFDQLTVTNEGPPNGAITFRIQIPGAFLHEGGPV